jgi:hypothetical protein
MRETRNAYRVLVGKRLLERPRHFWDDITTDLKETG